MKKIKLADTYFNSDDRKEHVYKEDWDTEMVKPLYIKVQAPYEIGEWEGNKVILTKWMFLPGTLQKLPPKGMNIKDLYNKAQEQYKDEIRIYNPFEEREQLISAVANLNLGKEESILDFCNTYGVLNPNNIIENEEDVALLAGINLNGHTEDLNYFIREIRLLQMCIRLYEAIKKKDIKWLEFFIKDGTKDELILEAKKRLRYLINSRIHLVSPSLRIGPNEEFIPGETSYSLLGVIYYHLYQIIANGYELKSCEYCGDRFSPRKTNARFCLSKEANGHSKCSNRYDAMVRRIRNWHFKDGLSVEEIQKKINKPRKRTLSEIEEIIESYREK
jgi:hypothetical protein